MKVSFTVPDCSVRLAGGVVTGTTSAYGSVRLDLGLLNDGWHSLEARPSDTSTSDPGPGFPPDPTKERIWRPFSARLRTNGGVVVEVDGQGIVLEADRVLVMIKPVWLQTIGAHRRDVPLDTIVVHHTGSDDLAGDLRHLVASGQASANYVVAADGTIFKLAADDHYTWHAGHSWWAGRDGLNRGSIGIEIVHGTGKNYPEPQLQAAIELIHQLVRAFAIPPSRVIGHSDIATNRPDQQPPKLLGRKSTDPGSAFFWERLETLGLGLVPVPGEPAPNMYGEVFTSFPGILLRDGDNDASRKYGGVVRPSVRFPVIATLQGDLLRLGYWCPVDGDFGRITARTVQMFQQHAFSGSRRRGSDPWNSGDGRCDVGTVHLLKRMLGEVAPPLGV